VNTGTPVRASTAAMVERTLAAQRTSASLVRDYLSLAKVRTIGPHLLTATSAMLIAAEGRPPLHTLGLTLVGGGLVAAASNTLNCYLDRGLDARMRRTRSRPLPAGRIDPRSALTYGLITGMLGLLILVRFVGLAAAVLAFAALIYYVFAYTMLLKRRAPWNVLIGSGAGALTPLIGWVAVADRLTAAPFLLSAVIVLWTLPHFWALAIFRSGEYQRAGVRVLPSRGVTAGTVACSVLTAGVSLLLAWVARLDLFYLGTAAVLGTGFVFLALQMRRRGRLSEAKRFYRYSIVYITLLFVAMIVTEVPLPGIRQ
jgi:protoheme IX farnesyltransferase